MVVAAKPTKPGTNMDPKFRLPGRNTVLEGLLWYALCLLALACLELRRPKREELLHARIRFLDSCYHGRILTLSFGRLQHLAHLPNDRSVQRETSVTS